MDIRSRLPTWKALAIGLSIILGGFGSPAALQAHGSSSHQQTECTTLREKPTIPAETCCPVDPKEMKKEQKAAEHAQHEAAEQCARNQKAYKHAQHEADEARARAEAKEAKVDNLSANMCCKPAEPVAEAAPPPLPPPPEPERAKPTPPAPIEEPAPPPELPKTASPLSLIGLIGLAFTSSGYLIQLFRRKYN
jgi:LPXTG-motif cell wall-anchored protein